MDARVVNSFIKAGCSVVNNFMSEDIKTGKVTVRRKSYPSEELNIIIGILGQMRGEVTYGMSSFVAMNIVSKMMGGLEVKSMDDMAYSAISELSNMISGNAVTNMSSENITLDLTPPTIVTGKNIKFHTLEIKTLNIPLETEVGIIMMDVALEEI